MHTTALLALLAVLLLLEYLFWFSPAKPFLDRLMQRMGHLYELLPFHYLLRLAALAAVLLIWRPALGPSWPAGAAAWGFSLLMGLLLSLLSGFSLLKVNHIPVRNVLGQVALWWRESWFGSWRQMLYVLAYPALVEEFLFRWFFTAALWPSLGWWTLLAAPAINLVWHLPVWTDLAGKQAPAGKRFSFLAMIAGPATGFAVVLTLWTVFTGNILAAVMAHAFADWIGSAVQYQPKQKAA